MISHKIPLPFQGNKSKHISQFIDYVKQCPATTYIDLFGGSCYLSYVVHKLKPEAKTNIKRAQNEPKFDEFQKRNPA